MSPTSLIPGRSAHEPRVPLYLVWERRYEWRGPQDMSEAKTKPLEV